MLGPHDLLRPAEWVEAHAVRSGRGRRAPGREVASGEDAGRGEVGRHGFGSRIGDPFRQEVRVPAGVVKPKPLRHARAREEPSFSRGAPEPVVVEMLPGLRARVAGRDRTRLGRCGAVGGRRVRSLVADERSMLARRRRRDLGDAAETVVRESRREARPVARGADPARRGVANVASRGERGRAHRPLHESRRQQLAVLPGEVLAEKIAIQADGRRKAGMVAGAVRPRRRRSRRERPGELLVDVAIAVVVAASQEREVAPGVVDERPSEKAVRRVELEELVADRGAFADAALVEQVGEHAASGRRPGRPVRGSPVGVRRSGISAESAAVDFVLVVAAVGLPVAGGVGEGNEMPGACGAGPGAVDRAFTRHPAVALLDVGIVVVEHALERAEGLARAEWRVGGRARAGGRAGRNDVGVGFEEALLDVGADPVARYARPGGAGRGLRDPGARLKERRARAADAGAAGLILVRRRHQHDGQRLRLTRSRRRSRLAERERVLRVGRRGDPASKGFGEGALQHSPHRIHPAGFVVLGAFGGRGLRVGFFGDAPGAVEGVGRHRRVGLRGRREARAARPKGAGASVKERVSAVAVLDASARRESHLRQKARLLELVLRSAREVRGKPNLLESLEIHVDRADRAAVRVARVRRVVSQRPGSRRQRAVHENREVDRGHHPVEVAVEASLDAYDLARRESDLLRHPAAGARGSAHLHPRGDRGAARRGAVSPLGMRTRPVSDGVAVAVRIGERTEVPAVASAAEVVRVAIGLQVVEARDLLVEEVAVPVAVPHLVGACAFQIELAAVARDLPVPERAVEHVLAAVRSHVALAERDSVPAVLDRAERELPADPERGVPDQRPVGEGLLRGRGLARLRCSEIVDARVVDQGQLQAQIRADGVGRAESNRQGELPVVEVDRIDLLVMEHAVRVSGRGVRVVVGTVLRGEAAGREQQRAETERP